MVILDRELLTTIRSVKPSPSRSAARNSPMKLSMGYVSGPLKPKLFVVSELLARPRLVMPSQTQAITAAVLKKPSPLRPALCLPLFGGYWHDSPVAPLPPALPPPAWPKPAPHALA